MNNIKYTFLLPAYKSKFFAEALESIKNQTHKDFACLVSDDCSPEDLKSIYSEVVGADPRFTYRRNIENMGNKSLVSHWNLLVDMCKTEFFIVASDDDVYESNFLEEIDKLTKKYPNVDLYRGRIRTINSNGSSIATNPLSDEFVTAEQFVYDMHTYKYAMCMAHMVYRTLALKLIGGIPEAPLALTSDQRCHLLMSRNGVAATSDIVFSYRMSDINISSQNYNNKVVASAKFKAYKDYMKWLLHYIDNMSKDNLFQKYSETEVLVVSKRHFITCFSETIWVLSFGRLLCFLVYLRTNKVLLGVRDMLDFYMKWKNSKV